MRAQERSKGEETGIWSGWERHTGLGWGLIDAPLPYVTLCLNAERQQGHNHRREPLVSGHLSR